MMSWGYIFNIRYKYKTYFSNNRHLSMFFSQYHRIVSDCSGLLKSGTRTMMTTPVTICIYISINSDVVFPQYIEQVCL